MSDDEKTRHQQEYEKLLALFISFLKNIDSNSRNDIVYALMELRADIAIQYGCDGFGMDEEEALQLLRNVDENTLSPEQNEKRKRIIAMVENLIAFAVCEEYHVVKDTDKVYKKHKKNNPDYEIDYNDSDDIDEYTDINEQYNDQYAAVENADIMYAMGIAAWWLGMNQYDLITYWTMNDAKVRPWHMALQGYTAPRDEFPSWMIPPIEWNCRCFLLPAEKVDPSQVWDKADFKRVVGKVPTKPKQIDDTFSESVAKCGRIFGKSHNYFKVDKADKDFLDDCVKRIKDKYYAKEH